MKYYVGNFSCSDELWHFGIKGMSWGRRRYQNEDGTYTAEGRARYGVGERRPGILGMFGKRRPMSGMNSASNYGHSPRSGYDSSYSKTGGVTVDSSEMRDNARLSTMMVRPEDHKRTREQNARRAFDIFRQTQAMRSHQTGNTGGGFYNGENSGLLGGSYGNAGKFGMRKPNEEKSGPVYANSERDVRKRKRDKALRSFASSFERLGSKIGLKKAKSDPSTRVGYSSASKVVEQFGGGSVSADRGAGLSNSVNNWYRPGDSFLWDVRSNKR